MNQGKPLSVLHQELKRQSESAEDLVADTQLITMDTVSGQLALQGYDQPYALTGLAHRQLAEWAKIPLPYYQRLQEYSTELLAENINHWLHNPAKTVSRMIRTLDGKARAFLSDKYRRLDNYLLLKHILPVLLEHPEIDIVSCDVTETRLYIKALFPRIQADINKKGDIVQLGIVISNSEVGLGRLMIEPLVYRLACLNGLITDASKEFAFKKQHVGARITADENYRIYSDETLKADDIAVMMKLKDSVRAMMSQTLFNGLVEKMQQAAQSVPVVAPVKAVEVLAKELDLKDTEKDAVLENLIRDHDYTRWGATNAVTHLANTTGDYERATELEKMGGKVLVMPEYQWQAIAKAA